MLSKEIATNNSLIKICLKNNGFSRKGGEALISSLAYSQTIVDFDISSLDGLNRNIIGPQAMEPLEHILKFNKFLMVLNVSGNCI